MNIHYSVTGEYRSWGGATTFPPIPNLSRDKSKPEWEWCPYFSHTLEFIIYFAIHLHPNIEMPICATRTATSLIPYSHRFNGTISYFGFTTTYTSTYHCSVFMALIRTRRIEIGCGNTQFKHSHKFNKFPLVFSILRKRLVLYFMNSHNRPP